MAHPVDPGVAVGGVEDGHQRVAAMRLADAVRDGQQVQVVVAEQAGGRVAQVTQQAQRAQAVGAAVDQVPEHDHMIA